MDAHHLPAKRITRQATEKTLFRDKGNGKKASIVSAKKIVFPSSMYRFSDAEEHADKEDFPTIPLSTDKVFEGDNGSSALRKISAKLHTVQTQQKRAIDKRFPANKPAKVKTNLILLLLAEDGEDIDSEFL
jgi:hypothetical protein